MKMLRKGPRPQLSLAFNRLSSIDDEDPEGPTAALARLDKEVSDKTAEIERMAPNMKAMEQYVALNQ
jgi:hypothetical protein